MNQDSDDHNPIAAQIGETIIKMQYGGLLEEMTKISF